MIIDKAWRDLTVFLTKNNPSLLQELNPPASDAEIEDLEQTIEHQLPLEVKRYLKCHNGQRGIENNIFDIFLLSTYDMINEWKIWRNLLQEGMFSDMEASPDKEIDNTWWNKNWLPFTNDGRGNHTCIDFSPTMTGNYGQIIEIWHDDPERKILYPCFSKWFIEKVQTLIKGH